MFHLSADYRFAQARAPQFDPNDPRRGVTAEFAQRATLSREPERCSSAVGRSRGALVRPQQPAQALATRDPTDRVVFHRSADRGCSHVFGERSANCNGQAGGGVSRRFHWSGSHCSRRLTGVVGRLTSNCGEVALRVHAVAAARAREAGEGGRGAAGAFVAHEEAVLGRRGDSTIRFISRSLVLLSMGTAPSAANATSVSHWLSA